MNKYYLIVDHPNLVLRCCSSSSSCVQILFTAKVNVPQKASGFSARSADGFGILPDVRHESTMAPFVFNALAIGTTTV
jgi:hypothetical protein